MNTEQFQRQFAAVLNGQSTDFTEDSIAGPAPMAQLLQLYQNNYIISLSEYLQTVFPVCSALVGDEFFAQLAKAYIRACPPSMPQVDGYGARFAEFIGQCPQTEALPYLSDVANLEWQLDRLTNQRYKTVAPFPFAQLSQLTITEQSQVRFQLNPNLQSLQSEHPVLAIVEAVNSGDFSKVNLNQPQSLVLLLQQDQRARFHPVNRSDVEILRSLANSRMDILTETYGETIIQKLPQWIQQGFIVGFNLQNY